VTRVSIIFGIAATDKVVFVVALEEVAVCELLAALFKINLGHSPLGLGSE